MYEKARAGEIKNFTGIDDPYEVPVDPEVHLRTDELTVEEEVTAIMGYLEINKVIEARQLIRADGGDDSAAVAV
ncbi:MAG: hypothetical protein CM1200mP36_00530 [Gammaproteobacteria bacterium]|nr:MAG: hypothetical protein CM1200mP36_00530 [Gammaproteobacteria bacterium]